MEEEDNFIDSFKFGGLTNCSAFNVAWCYSVMAMKVETGFDMPFAISRHLQIVLTLNLEVCNCNERSAVKANHSQLTFISCK